MGSLLPFLQPPSSHPPLPFLTGFTVKCWIYTHLLIQRSLGRFTSAGNGVDRVHLSAVFLQPEGPWVSPHCLQSATKNNLTARWFGDKQDDCWANSAILYAHRDKGCRCGADARFATDKVQRVHQITNLLILSAVKLNVTKWSNSGSRIMAETGHRAGSWCEEECMQTGLGLNRMGFIIWIWSMLKYQFYYYL